VSTFLSWCSGAAGRLCLAGSYVLLWLVLPLQAAQSLERVQIADPYLELRTGPGRGYPVYYVADRGEWVEIIKRRTDWFKVRTENGKEGWASRSQMERTLTEAGVARTFRDVLLDDYLGRRLEFGFSAGRFEDDPMLVARVGYKLTDNLVAELVLSRVSGNFSSTRLIYGSLVSHPFPDWRISPFFSIGFGNYRNEPKATLINTPVIDTETANAAVGAQFFVTRRFITRLDYRRHIAFIDDNRTEKFNEISAGLYFFF
jgi:hypothetical protein